MQALGLFSRRAILGRSNKSTVVLEKIAKENSLNRTGSVNFNTYGKQDGIGFASLLRREMLDRYGLQKCKVKAVALSPRKEQPKDLDKVYGRPA